MTTLTWPDSIIVKTLELTSEQALVSSEARNKRILSRELSGHRFDLSMIVNIAPFNYKAGFGFVTAMQIDGYNVYYTDSDWMGGTNTTVDGAVTAGTRNVTLASSSGYEVFDFINFGNHDKLYQIVNKTGSDIVLNTPLLSDVPDTTAAILDKPKLLIELAPDLKRSSTLASKLTRELSSVSLRFVEVV